MDKETKKSQPKIHFDFIGFSDSKAKEWETAFKNKIAEEFQKDRRNRDENRK